MICNYCGKEVMFCENKEIYGKNYGKSYMCYYCKDCNAYVGTHNNTIKPLGTMANKELRDLRIQAHLLFDKLWKDGNMTRKQAYKLLSDKMGVKEFHIGESNLEQCKKVLDICNKLNKVV